MAYVKQTWSTGDIITAGTAGTSGLNHLEDQYAQAKADLDAKLDPSSGHKHTGGSGDAPKLNPTTALTYVPLNKAGDTATNLVLAGTLTGKTRPGATLVVAASNSSASGKALADYTCDGTDDQAEINTAINALSIYGGRVLLLEGAYTVSDSINLRGNVDLEGSSWGTQITLAANRSVWTAAILGNNIAYARVANLVVYAGTQTNSVVGVKVIGTSGSNIDIENVKCDSAKLTGIWVDSCTLVRVRNCIISNAENGIYVAAASDDQNVLVEGNIATNITGYGIQVHTVNRSVFVNNVCTWCTIGGIVVDGTSTGNVIAHNLLAWNGASDAVINNASGTNLIEDLAGSAWAFTNPVTLKGGGTLSSSQTLTNSGTISGGTVNPASLTVSGAATFNGGATVPAGQTLTVNGPTAGPSHVYARQCQAIVIYSGGTNYVLVNYTEVTDTNSEYVAPTFTAKTAGYYRFTASILASGGSPNTSMALAALKNGSTYMQQTTLIVGSYWPSIEVNGTVYLNGTTDYIQIQVSTTSGTNVTVANTDGTYCYLTIDRIL